MKFLKENENLKPYVDNIFSVVKAAKADPEAINATAGCLFNEDGRLFVYETVFNSEKEVPAVNKAAYAAAPAGNPDYLQVMEDFVLEGRVSNKHGVIATAGGTGALATAIATCRQYGETILIPEISWGNYQVIADENGLKVMRYDMYDLEDLFGKIAECGERVFLIINSPCENPLGHAYSLEEWEKIMARLNSLDKEVILLCDIAYIDYASGDPKQYFRYFNELNDNVLVLLAVSCSKTFSYYGQRLGLLIVINNDQHFIDVYLNLCERYARSTWSNLNNGAMHNIADVLLNHQEEYRQELEEAKTMLKKRTDLFIRQAQECGLELYKFADGFFVTVRMNDNQQRDEYHQRLIKKHIYTIKVNKGIRIGLCSVPLKIVDGLAYKMKELL